MLTKENLKSNRQKFYRYLYKNMSCCYLLLLNIMVIWFAYLIIDLVLQSLQIVKNGKFFLKKKLKFTYFKTSKSRLWSWKYQNLSLAAYSLVLILLFSKKQTPASTHFPNFKAFLICIAFEVEFYHFATNFFEWKKLQREAIKDIAVVVANKRRSLRNIIANNTGRQYFCAQAIHTLFLLLL